MRRLRQAAAWAVQPAGLALLVVALFMLVVLALGRFPSGGERTLLWLTMAAAAAAALLFLAAREQLVEVAKRIRYGHRPAPDDVVERLRGRFSRAVPLEELLLELVEVLREGLGLSSAEVWTRAAEGLELAVSDPERGRPAVDLPTEAERVVARAGVSGASWARVWLPGLAAGRDETMLLVVPVTHAGELHGLLVAEGGPLSSDEERVLVDLARDLGLALHNLELDSALQASLEELGRQASELRASRARVVAAADAERRRIERDLHDGAQQRLVALAVKLRLVRVLERSAPGDATRLLDEIAEELETTVEELRDLAHGIYPPLLIDGGLAEAIPAAGARTGADVKVAANGRYPAEIEAAVYFCCLEALQNAAKHAGDGIRPRVRVWQSERCLLFEVADDGAGFEPTGGGGGAGLTNMRDRVGAVGGRVEIESAPRRGTTVSGAIPLA